MTDKFTAKEVNLTISLAEKLNISVIRADFINTYIEMLVENTTSKSEDFKVIKEELQNENERLYATYLYGCKIGYAMASNMYKNNN